MTIQESISLAILFVISLGGVSILSYAKGYREGTRDGKRNGIRQAQKAVR
jgi:hypothetical protein